MATRNRKAASLKSQARALMHRAMKMAKEAEVDLEEFVGAAVERFKAATGSGKRRSTKRKKAAAKSTRAGRKSAAGKKAASKRAKRKTTTRRTAKRARKTTRSGIVKPPQ